MLTGNLCQFNNVAQIQLAGRTQKIPMSGNVPAGGVGGTGTAAVTAATYSGPC
jgi:hypothetical protein